MKLFSLRTLRWLGEISYGTYLWHWPLYLILTPARVGLEGWGLTALRIGASLAVASLSYRFVEQPIRKGGLSGRRALSAALAGIAVVAIVTVTVTRSDVALAPARTSDSPIQTGPPSILLVGDSVAQSLGHAMQRTAKERGWQVRTVGMLGCGLLRTERMRFSTGEVLCQNRVRRAVANETGATLLDLEAWICPDGICRREVDGQLVRKDGVHYRSPGGDIVAVWLLDQVAPALQ